MKRFSTYVCEGCGHRHRCRAHPDDSQEALRLLSAPGTDTNRDLLRAIGLPQRVGAFCEAEGLLVGRLGVAVSGGVDSMVLMHCLVEMGHRPLVISMDHGLREESAGELAEVERCARALGLEFSGHCLRLEDGPNLAERARDARYAIMESLDLDSIAVGHHCDDQVETVLDRMLRGSSSSGLSGMSARRGRFVRPLLEESRADISAWARLKQISFFDDPSNRKGTRSGRIRHELIPLIRSIREGAPAAILRTAHRLATDEDVLHELSVSLLGPNGLDVRALENSSSPLVRRALLQLVREARGDARGIGATHLDQILSLSKPGSWSGLPGGGRAVLDGCCFCACCRILQWSAQWHLEPGGSGRLSPASQYGFVPSRKGKKARGQRSRRECVQRAYLHVFGRTIRWL